MRSSTNITWQNPTVTRECREKKNNHRSVIVWFTGLSGSGKSTLAHAIEDVLHSMGCSTFVLDGDNVRHGLCRDLGFSDQDRVENIRRIGEVANLFLDAGFIVLTAFISPFKADRNAARALVGDNNFIEVYCDSAIDICEQRDVKGLYQKARAGEIDSFTGISSPYEKPESPELVVETGVTSIEDCVEQVVNLLVSKKIIHNADQSN